MNPVDTIISLTRYKAPLKAIPPEEHDLWRQYLRRGPDQRRQENQEILAAFRSLSDKEAEDLAHYAVDLYDERLDTDNSLACHILMQIASFVEGGLQSVYGDILRRHIIFLPALFRGADAATRDALFTMIQAFEGNDYDFGRLADGLAWIGDEIVQQHIIQWRQHPPNWRTPHYINFDRFEIEAGWELTKEGRRRDLYFPQASELVSDDTAQHPVGIIAQHVASCGWCGRDLETLFDLDLADSQLSFLNLTGTRLRVAYCPQCSFYGKHVYTDIDFDGWVGWSRENASLQEQDDISYWQPMSLVGRKLVLGQRRRTPFELQGALFSYPCSQLGGAPSWVQWSDFPHCPSCTQRMMYLGQVETTDVIDRGEGVTYGFLCIECRKATTTFQQT